MDESIQWFVWDGYTVLVTLLECSLFIPINTRMCNLSKSNTKGDT